MKEYIEKESAKNELNRIEKLYRDTYVSKVRAEMVSYCCEVVKHLPVADVVEVVRCPECILHDSCSTEDVFKFARLNDDRRFCGVGKRKGGDE